MYISYKYKDLAYICICMLHICAEDVCAEQIRDEYASANCHVYYIRYCIHTYGATYGTHVQKLNK